MKNAFVIKLKLRRRQLLMVAKYAVCRALALFTSRDYWVFVERGDDARDNGYWMYRYVKDKYPSRKLCYIIDKKSADHVKVREDAVQLGSMKNYWMLARAEKIISTHYAGGIIDRNPKIFRLLGLHKRFYFLQHGITYNEQFSLYSINAPMRLFCCGALPEYRYVYEHFKHPDGVVRYTGLARFDGLHDVRLKRQILVMPTWRKYIKSEAVFLESEYYRQWQNILSNADIARMLEKADVQLVFYAHYEIQPYIGHFSACSERIEIAGFDEFDVQTLLKESAVLLTDYSSVFFDFAYMRKPALFYQFDRDDFYGNHYNKGYFDYESMGFGDVCICENDVVESLRRILESGLNMEAKYSERADKFFPLHDINNCERIYEIIAGE